MRDLIDRQAAIEALFDWEMTYDWDDHCREEDPKPAYIVSPSDVIEHLPTVEPEPSQVARDIATIIENEKDMRVIFQQPRWIPVSERLPEDWEDVLVWFEYFRYGDYNCMYSTYGIGNYINQYDSWLINHETGWKDLHVFAWMPLPKPYGGAKQE